MMIVYEFDSNNILAEPSKYLTGLHIKNVWKKNLNLLCSRGLKPQMYVLDNECSQHLNDYMLEENEGFQLVPPHLHRLNASERAIQTFKNHFIAGLVSMHDNFPLNL